MGKKWGRLSARNAPGGTSLNITSLMDMMTIILIFLLFSFSAQDQNIRMEKDIELPNSNSEKPFKWAINIMVSQKQLKVEDEMVCPLKDGRFVAKKEENGKVIPLFNRLVKLKDVEAYRNVDRDTEEPVVIFHADRKHRFETIYTIMKTAAMAGYPNFRFAVLKK